MACCLFRGMPIPVSFIKKCTLPDSILQPKCTYPVLVNFSAFLIRLIRTAISFSPSVTMVETQSGNLEIHCSDRPFAFASGSKNTDR